MLWVFTTTAGEQRESGEAMASYEVYAELIQLMSELARGEVRRYMVWVIVP